MTPEEIAAENRKLKAELAQVKSTSAAAQQERDYFRGAYVNNQIYAHAERLKAKQPADFTAALSPSIKLQDGQLTAVFDGERMPLDKAMDAMAKAKPYLVGDQAPQGAADLVKLASDDPQAYVAWAEKNIDKR
jgi:hypothetical protein